MMVEYVRAVCRGHVIDGQIRAFDPDWLKTDEGVKRYERLSKISTTTTAIMTRLASAMRLTQQSRILKDKVIPKAGRKLWQRESPEN